VLHIARLALCSRTKLFRCICWLRACARKCFHCLTHGPWYAAKCILQWADLRDNCSCPQCKKPFSRLLTYRTLDGTMSDFPVEESVCLLKRATWIQEQLKASHATAVQNALQSLRTEAVCMAWLCFALHELFHLLHHLHSAFTDSVRG